MEPLTAGIVTLAEVLYWKAVVMLAKPVFVPPLALKVRV